jgi:uncharacterized RDD family membrane protein YckC
MEFTQGAKDLIEKNLHDIMGYMTLAEKDRADVEKELRSSFYEGSEARAKERNSSTVTEEDVRKAFGDEGTPQEITAAYMKSYAGGLKRAGFWWRSAAYIIDGIILAIIIFILASPFILISMWAQYIDQTSWIVGLVILVNLAIGLIALGVIFCYTVVFEGRWGRTPGKYILGLKVIKVDGTPIGYKEALLRNIPKFFGNFIIIDALIMVIFFGKEKQRAFDKVADTIVVHTRG